MLMNLIAAILAVAVVVLFRRWRQQQRVAEGFFARASVLAGHADLSRTPFDLLQQGIGVPRITILAQGGNLKAGVFAGLGKCPCQHTYTVATTIFPLNAWPNPIPNPLAGFPWNAPPRQPEPWQCPGNCVVVCTEVWRGWMVVQLNNRIQMNIHTFAQYHCKPPNDPDAGKPPQGEELPPRPEEVSP
jgi:hypothetical protein